MKMSSRYRALPSVTGRCLHANTERHGHFGLGPFQPVGPVEGCELRPQVGVHDFGRAELVDGLVQRLDAEVGLQRVGDAPSQNLTGEPVHDGHQIEDPFAHRRVCDVGAPDLIGSVDPQPAQQIGVGLVPLCGLAGMGFWVDRHQSHKAHQSPDALFINGMALVLQVSCHLPDTIERRFQKLFVDLQHQIKVQRRLSPQRVMKR